MTMPMQWALRRRMMMAALGSGIDISALSIAYTGAYTDYGMVTMSDGARYRLLAFTASGTLSIEQPVNCEVCVVGGGANGNNYNAGGTGGAGGYLKNQAITKYNGGAVVVGAAQAASSVGEVSVEAVSGKNGGTGGGGSGNDTPGVGDGISKFPFGDESYSLWTGKPHCAGGGAVLMFYEAGGGYSDWYSGGDGGTNGGNGNDSTYAGTTMGYSGAPGKGGTYGGGSGGGFGSGGSFANGGNATYYGSAGGASRATQGSGYQGIVYIRIPEDQAA